MRHVIIGNGVAANSAAEAIRQLDPSGSVTMLTRSRHYFYYVPALPEYLAGEKTLADFTLHDQSWYEKHNIDLRLGTEAVAVDPAEKTVATVSGEVIPYDRLLLATGGKSFIPPIPGADQDGVVNLRTIEDADRIIEQTAKAHRLLVIGGGLIGLEAGNGLRKRGLEVSVIETATRLLPRQTDPACSALLQQQLEEMGFTFLLGATPREIIRTGDRFSVHIEGGGDISTEVVLLISAGVRPDLLLAQALGLEIGRGVKVNDLMATSREDIFAAGDLVEHRGRYYGIWPAATAQGRVAGTNMAGGTASYQGTLPSNRLKVAGINLVAAGEIDAEGGMESLVSKNEQQRIYRKLVLREGSIVGAVLLGDVRGADYIQYAMQKGLDISALKDEILQQDFDFGRLKKL
jgi:nitrite reductase (NADH) large subunit